MPAKRKNPAAELAEKLLAVLEAQRALGKEAYPLTLQRLAELADPLAAPEVIDKAVATKLFKDHVIVAQKKNRAAPVALKDDGEQLAASPLLLEFALDQLCSPASPICPPSKLKSKVDTKLKKPLEEAAARQIREHTLPPAVGYRLEKNKPVLFLHRIPPAPLPPPPKKAEVVLAEKLLAVLEAQRALGKEAYPLSLQRLAELADPLAAPELIGKAVGTKLFKDGTIAASKKDPGGLVTLTADKEQLASDPRLLEWALAPLCTPESPLWPLAKVKNRIENTELRKSFEEAVRAQVLENRLPGTVGYRLEKDKPLLFLTSNPPRNRDEVLAEKLLRVLEAQRQRGGDSYPLPLGRLVELTEPGTKAQLVNKALAQPAIQGRLLLIDAKKPEAPVAFVQDRDQLLSSRSLLEYLLRAKHKPNQNAFPVDGLLPKKSDLFQPILDAINLKIEANSLPPTIGWMWIGKKRQIFFLEDVHHGRQTDARAAAPTPPPAAPSPLREAPADFALAFDEAFNQINRRNGGHNFVSLVDMRRALPLPADAFDAELRKLRVAGRYTLSAAEGRHGISPEEQKAGIVEDGSLLLYVSRKAP